MDVENFYYMCFLMKHVSDDHLSASDESVQKVLNFIRTYLERRDVVVELKKKRQREKDREDRNYYREYDEVGYGPEGPRGFSDKEKALDIALRNARKHLKRTNRDM